MAGLQAAGDAGGSPQHTPDRIPTTIQALSAAMAEIDPVGKNQVNEGQRFKFRGIDDLMSACAGPMRRHGVMVFPEVLDERYEVRGRMNTVIAKIAFHFYGPDGTKVSATVLAEASDTADKAANKAMSAGLKYALLQVFMIPVDGKSIDDGDRQTPEDVPHPADRFVQQLRNPQVWNNPAAMTNLLAQVSAAGMAGYPVASANGQALGAIAEERIAALRVAAEERAARKAEEAPQAAAQIAAEHGVAAPAPAAPANPVELLNALGQRVGGAWDDLPAMEKVRVDAEQQGLLGAEVPGPTGELVKVGFLLDTRLAELRQHGQQAGQNVYTAAGVSGGQEQQQRGAA